MAPTLRPPGPESHGLLGNFPMGSDDPLALFTQWAQHFGDIFYYRVLTRRVYFLNHPELIKSVLVTNPQNFIKGEAVRYNRRIFGNGLVASEGDSWRQQRRLIQPAFHREQIDSYGDTMSAFTARMLDLWQHGETRDIHRDMMRLTLEIVAKTLFDVDILPERDHISEALDTLMQLSSGGRMLLPPALRRIPTPGNLRYFRAIRRLDHIVHTLIHQRRASPSPARDILSTLLESRDDSGQPLSTQQLRDEVMTLLLTGHETTAVSLSWTWYLLAQHPEAERKLHAELHTVLAGRTPTMRDLPSLPYTDRVIKESMRLFPPVWAIVRNPIQNCEIAGYQIPAGATILMSQWVTHRDPRFYHQPEAFNPDRWLDDSIKSNPKFAYFPFGGGPRTCIGASFASAEAALVLATIAQKYQLRLTQTAPIQPIPAITLRPRNGVPMILTRRNT